ncbi:MAG TPA: TonB-dependent receptor [Hyphomonas sp.]|nr:TonB-dependent receptor [Hyphomonas sp.]HRI99558.1 TonB-dependent receptor [Hyphomonas sp.]HRK67380.1 TonB-dependent receptor [Hyphomonas sp.]
MRFRDTSFNFRLLMGAAAVGLMAGSATAQEQDATDESEARQETVVVTGFRQSLQQAIAVKRNETGIVDAISAEDIADFPDLNLAEALQRVPGVQIDRDGGEGRSISVRGLSSDFVRVQINGMEALATTGGRDGRANRNRQFDFNVFAADLFTSVKVAKSQDARTDEGSLGATVHLRSAKPFDYDGFTFAAGAQASYNDLSEETDPRITGLVSNTWLDGRLGALVSVAYSTRNTFEEGSSTGRFRVPADDGCVAPYVNLTRCYQSVGTVTTADGTVLTGAAAALAAANGAHPRIPRYGRIGYDRERLGITGALQFEPWEGTEFTFDSLYAQLDQTRSEEFLEVISFARETGVQGLRAVDLVSGVVDDNRTLVSGTFNDVDIRTEQRIDVLSTEFFQNSLGFESEISDNLRLSGMAGVSRAIGSNSQQTTISLEVYDVDGYQYDYSNPGLPYFNYNFDVTNPANYVFSSSTALGDASIIRLRPNKTLNTYETARLDLAYDVNDIFTVSGGVSYKEFGFNVRENRKASEGVTATTLAALAANGYTQADYTTVLTNFGRGMSLPAGTPTSWIIPDLNALKSILEFDCNCINQYGDWRLTQFAGETRGATEKSTGAYVQVDWNADLGYIPVRGNVGVRYVETDLTANGILSGNPETVNFKYEDTLPAMTVVVEPVENVIFRVAAAKTMARPNLTALTPGGSIDASPPGLSLTAGNPFLEPIRSNNVDLSLEWYPYDEALFSVAVFRKNIESFNQRLLRSIPYSETGFPNSLLGPGVTPDDIFNVTTFVNTPGGVLNGIELTAQTPFNFDFIPEPLKGFGGLLSYTKIDSEFDYIINVNTGATVTQPLVGQSPESLSATLYYERGPFEARISSTWRDEYLTTVPAASGNDVEGKAATLNLDFSASYELSDKIVLTFEAINLTDVYDERWISSTRQNSLNYEHTGREFVFGVRYRY